MVDTPICTIDDTGIHRPEFADVLSYFINGVRDIYGVDTYLGNDSQDGQLVGLLAKAVDDCNTQTVADYEAYSPSTAQGTGLSSVVKTNNIRRKVPSYSTVPVTLYGVWGTVVTSGIVSDGTNRWRLPATVIIPFTGQITVTAICTATGAVTIQTRAIDTAQGRGSVTAGTAPGWQSVANLSPSAPGSPVESDPQLRARQSLSTSISAQTTLDALRGALLAVDGVTYVKIYDNGRNITDVNGVPGHSIAVVVDGGDDGLIAQIIALKKGVCGTYGSSSQIVTDVHGIARVIRYFRSSQVNISASLTLKIVGAFTQSYQAAIASALATYISAQPTGDILYRLQQLEGIENVGSGYKVEGISLSRDGLVPSESDVSLALYERPYCSPANVTFPGLPPLPGATS